LVPFGDAWKNRDEVYCPVDEIKKHLDAALMLARREGVYIWTNRLPVSYLEGFEDLIQSPVKMADEIRGMELELKAFIKTGAPLLCKGERCAYCFMRGFCQDLAELRLKKILYSRQFPACMDKIKKGGLESFRFRSNMNVYRFLDFFIEHRYFVKSRRCQGCRLHDECFGAPIEIIRTKGFKILNPLS